MKTKTVTRNLEGVLAAFALLAGCAEDPRIAKEAAEPASVGVEKEPCRGIDCVSQPADSEELDDAHGQAPAPCGEEAPTSEPDDDTRHASDEAAGGAPDEDVVPADEAGANVAVPEPTLDAAADADSHADSVAPAMMGGEVDSSVDGVVSPAACDPNPCQHGGACAGDDAGTTRCLCPDGFVGEHCETRFCGGATIRSQADLEALRECTEIRGDLTIASVGLAVIEPDDLPLLTKITGDLVISGPQASDQPLLQSVTLKHLRTIEGALMVLGIAVVEFGSSGPLRELHLPALESIGAHEALGLAVFQASLSTLDLPALKTIGGTVILNTLFELCTVSVESVESVGGALNVHYVPKLSPVQLEPFLAATAGQGSEQLLGCCEADLDDRVSCEAFTESARALYCGGCR